MRSIVLSTAPVMLGLLAAVSVAAAAPKIRSTRVLAPRVARYGCVELAPDVSGEWSNPFDPDQIDVSAEFTAPMGRRPNVPGFWCRDYAELPPATRARQQVEALTLFVYVRDWLPGTKVEFFVDDIGLLDGHGVEVAFDDMEEGETPRAAGVDGASAALSTETVHGGKRSLRFTPTLAGGQHWPAVLYRPGPADWSFATRSGS